MSYTYTPLSTTFAEIAIGMLNWGETRNSHLATIIAHLNLIGEQLEDTDGNIQGAIDTVTNHIEDTTDAHQASAISLPEETFGPSATVFSILSTIRDIILWELTIPEIEESEVAISQAGINRFKVSVTISDVQKQEFITAGGYVLFILRMRDSDDEIVTTSRFAVRDWNYSNSDIVFEHIQNYSYNVDNVVVSLRFSIMGRPGSVYNSDPFDLANYQHDEEVEENLNYEKMAYEMLERFQVVQATQTVKVKNQDNEDITIVVPKEPPRVTLR